MQLERTFAPAIQDPKNLAGRGSGAIQLPVLGTRNSQPPQTVRCPATPLQTAAQWVARNIPQPRRPPRSDSLPPTPRQRVPTDAPRSVPAAGRGPGGGRPGRGPGLHVPGPRRVRRQRPHRGDGPAPTLYPAHSLPLRLSPPTCRMYCIPSMVGVVPSMVGVVPSNAEGLPAAWVWRRSSASPAASTVGQTAAVRPLRTAPRCAHRQPTGADRGRGSGRVQSALSCPTGHFRAQMYPVPGTSPAHYGIQQK